MVRSTRRQKETESCHFYVVLTYFRRPVFIPNHGTFYFQNKLGLGETRTDQFYFLHRILYGVDCFVPGMRES